MKTKIVKALKIFLFNIRLLIIKINPFLSKAKRIEKLYAAIKKFSNGWNPDWKDQRNKKYYPYFEFYKDSNSLKAIGTLYTTENWNEHKGKSYNIFFESKEMAELISKK